MSERTVYAIASGKGGVGKTTTAINLGAMLADRDHSVVVVDTDLGMANLAGFLDFEVETPTLHEVLAGDADFEEAIYRAPGGIDVLPSATDIEAFTRSDPGNLQDVVAPLREEYDYVLLDTGAGVSYDTLVPLALADAVLLVATPDVASVRDTAKTGELAARVESEVAGAILTQRSSDILNADDVEETLGTDVLAVVPQDEAVPMGIDAGRPLAAFAPNAPAGQAYRELAAVVTGETDPDPELDLGGDADVEFDAEPPRRTDDQSKRTDDRTERNAEPPRQVGESGQGEPPAGEQIAENVRDAIESGSESGGLLGGELASAAEEIRGQSADRTTDEPGTEVSDSSGGEQGDADTTDVEGDDADAIDARETGSDANVASDARSVDDLINEHMGDDRLGGDDPLDGDDSRSEPGDPLAETDDERDDSRDAEPGDPLGGPGSAEVSGNEGREAGADSEDATDDGLDSGSIPFEEDSEPPSAEKGEGETEPSRESGAESGGVESGDAEADGVKTGTLADESDENSGVLGRLGSLFK